MLCCVASPGIHPELRSVSEAVATGVGVTEAEAGTRGGEHPWLEAGTVQIIPQS